MQVLVRPGGQVARSLPQYLLHQAVVVIENAAQLAQLRAIAHQLRHDAVRGFAQQGVLYFPQVSLEFQDLVQVAVGGVVHDLQGQPARGKLRLLTRGFRPHPVDTQGFAPVYGHQVVFANKEADLLGLQHQVLIQLDDAAKEDKGVALEGVHFRGLAYPADVGDGHLVAAQAQQLFVHCRGDFALDIQPQLAALVGLPFLQQVGAAFAGLAVACHHPGSNFHVAHSCVLDCPSLRLNCHGDHSTTGADPGCTPLVICQWGAKSGILSAFFRGGGCSPAPADSGF